jgi:tRNA(fMet)-specific endonuclease VapC
MIVLDTDHVGIYQWPQSDAAYALRDRLEACHESLAVTVISVEEQMRGWLSEIKRRAQPRRQILAYGRLQFIIGFFADWTILPWDERACGTFELLRKQRLRVGTMDLKIASIALANDALLLTRNFRDFEKVPNLRFEDWTE